MASLNVWEYAEGKLVLAPSGSLLIEDGVVRVFESNVRGYRLPAPEEAAEIAEALRRWAGQLEKSLEAL